MITQMHISTPNVKARVVQAVLTHLSTTEFKLNCYVGKLARPIYYYDRLFTKTGFWTSKTFIFISGNAWTCIKNRIKMVHPLGCSRKNFFLAHLTSMRRRRCALTADVSDCNYVPIFSVFCGMVRSRTYVIKLP